MHKSKWWVLGSIAATAIVSLWSLSYRYKVESANKAAGILMEGQALADLAATSGNSLPVLLAELKSHGLTGIALTEENVGDLIDRGDVQLAPKTGGGYSVTGNPASLARIARGIGRRGGLGSNPSALRLGQFDFDGDTKALRTTAVGLNPYDALCAKEAGLEIVARHANVLGANPAYIHDVLDESKSLGANAFLAAGEQVLGQRDSVEDMTSSLETLHMVYLTPEFTKIAGDAKATAFIPGRTIRLHSMQQAEVDKATPASIVDRYKLAFRERNIRWLLVRPVTFGGGDPVKALCESLESIKQGVASEGGALKTPRPFTEPNVPRVAFLLIGLFSVPWMAFVYVRYGRLDWQRWLIFVLLAGIGLAAFSESMRTYSALAIGVSGPIAAYALWAANRDRWSPLVSFLAVSLVSLTAGLAVAGLLNGLPYFIQVKQALGIKMILIAPVLAVGAMLLYEFWTPKDLMQQPIQWGQALLSLAVAGAVLVLLMRSGNDSPGAVSDAELKFRALLDRFMYTRPRTKEILLGHPAMVLGLLTYQWSRRSPKVLPIAVVLLTLGAVGQSDIVDTLCHLHTPLDIGLARIGLGVLIGGIIGLLAWVPLRALLRRIEGT